MKYLIVLTDNFRSGNSDISPSGLPFFFLSLTSLDIDILIKEDNLTIKEDNISVKEDVSSRIRVSFAISLGSGLISFILGNSFEILL